MMARTVLQSFDKLKSNLEITELQRSEVSSRQQQVRQALEKELTVLDSFLTGSYKRNTMIAPLAEADIDVFVVLHPSYYQQDGQASLLDMVKRILRKTYPRTPDISRNGQAVTIQFSDFMVDVVPAFVGTGGGYLIPNSLTGAWIATDPKKHVDIMSSANAAHDQNLVPLIKMVKAWNRQINRYFRSFHLEVLALQILDNVTITNFPSGMRYFLDKGRTHIRHKNPDPAGFGGDVGSYLNTEAKIDDAVSRFQTGYDRAIKAEDYDRRGYVAEAVNTWRMIFGDCFPAYG